MITGSHISHHTPPGVRVGLNVGVLVAVTVLVGVRVGPVGVRVMLGVRVLVGVRVGKSPTAMLAVITAAQALICVTLAPLAEPL